MDQVMYNHEVERQTDELPERYTDSQRKLRKNG